METWDNLVVCPNDWEPRHPQDFVRGREDDTSAKGLVRPEPPDQFIEVTYFQEEEGGDGGGSELPEEDVPGIFIDNDITDGDISPIIPWDYSSEDPNAIAITFGEGGELDYQIIGSLAPPGISTTWHESPTPTIGNDFEIDVYLRESSGYPVLAELDFFATEIDLTVEPVLGHVLTTGFNSLIIVADTFAIKDDPSYNGEDVEFRFDVRMRPVGDSGPGEGPGNSPFMGFIFRAVNFS
jgi:hypothetical protein